MGSWRFSLLLLTTHSGISGRSNQMEPGARGDSWGRHKVRTLLAILWQARMKMDAWKLSLLVLITHFGISGKLRLVGPGVDGSHWANLLLRTLFLYHS